MKKVILTAMISAVVLSANADYYVNVFTTGGFETSIGIGDGANPLLGVGTSAQVVLYFAGANGVADYADGSMGVALGGVASGDDVLLGSFLTTNTGAPFEEYALVNDVVGNSVYLGGLVFARIFDTNTASAGSWYYEGTVQSVVDIDRTVVPALLPAAYELGAGAIAPLNMGQVIPEPATLGMMAVAGLGMFLARKKARR